MTTNLNEKVVADSGRGSVEDKIYDTERMCTVKDCIELLSKNQQDVLVLKFQNDLSYKDISEITGLSITNVGYLIHTGIQNIRNNIKCREVL